MDQDPSPPSSLDAEDRKQVLSGSERPPSQSDCSVSSTETLEELEQIIGDSQQFQMFLNFLNEWETDIDLLFVVQVDQLVQVAETVDRFVIEEQFKKIIRKHIAEECELPLTQASQAMLSALREKAVTGDLELKDFVDMQKAVKRALDKNFVKRFTSDCEMPSEALGRSESYIPTLYEVVDDLECLQLFVLYLMKDSRHKVFFFWFEMQKVNCKGRELLLKLSGIHRKYARFGVKSPMSVEKELKVFQVPEVSQIDSMGEEEVQEEMGRVQSNMNEVNKRIGRILRLEFWPEFCKSELFHNLLQNRRNRKRSDSVGRRKRFSLLSLYKSHILSDEIVIAVPKPKEFFKDTRTPQLSLAEYVVVVEGIFNADRTHFKAKIIKKFPQSDLPEFPVPPHLELFCFPEQHSETRDKGQIPSPPRLFNFVLSFEGSSVYCCCVQLSSVRTGPSVETKDGNHLYAVCAVSKVPLVDRLRTLLRPLTEIDQSSVLWDVQQFTDVLNRMQTVQGTKHKYTKLQRYSIDPFSRQLSVPDFDFSSLFRLMHPYKILSVLEYLYCEKKVLLVSSQLSLLTIVGESLRILMYPFKFQFLYIPVLPRSLLNALQCPTPFLIGIHSSAREQALEMEQIHQDLYVIDLDYDSVSPAKIVDTPLPRSVRTKLLGYFRRASFRELVDIDFDQTKMARRWSQVSQLEEDESTVVTLRKCLVHAWLDDLLKDVQYFVVVVPDTREDQPPLILLDAPAFLKEKPKSYAKFLRSFFRTSAFSSFLGSIVSKHKLSTLSILGDYE